jgi:hypothetical protein
METEVYTRHDLIAYALIYAAMADYEMSDQEKVFIIDRVGLVEFGKMLVVYKNDSDLESLERIKLLKDEFFPGEIGKEELLNLIEEVFKCDHEYDALENVVYHGIRKLL